MCDYPDGEKSRRSEWNAAEYDKKRVCKKNHSLVEFSVKWLTLTLFNFTEVNGMAKL
jgi:hypothetical protein